MESDIRRKLVYTAAGMHQSGKQRHYADELMVKGASLHAML